MSAVPVGIDWKICKSGKLTAGVCGSVAFGGNNNHTPALITAINGVPTLRVNGLPAQLGPVIATLPPFTGNEITQTYQQYVHYLNEFGGVESIAMVCPGLTSYTSPLFALSGGNPVTPATLANGGAGSTLSGILSYEITNPGQNYTASFNAQLTIPGQSPSTPAHVYVVVTAGVVTAVVPWTGAPMSSGIGYTGATHANVPIVGGTGAGLIVTATVGTYVLPPKVTDPGKGYQSPPQVTVTDANGTGSGATAQVTMTGPSTHDSCIISYPENIFSTTVGGQPGSIPASPKTFVFNSVGKFEPDGNYSKGMMDTPIMPVGVNLGQTSTEISLTTYFYGKNKLKTADPWVKLAGTSSLTLDSNYYPISWTPGGTIGCQILNGSFFLASAQYQGTWTLQYDDDYYTGGSAQPQVVSLSSSGSSGVIFASRGNPAVDSNGTVTASYDMAFTAPDTGGYLVLTLLTTSGADGLQHVHNPSLFAPGNTIDRSNPYATDDNVVRALTNNGRGVGVIRAMSDLISPAMSNMQDLNDLLSPDLFSWDPPFYFNGQVPNGSPHTPGNPTPSGKGTFTTCRFWNTNVNSTVYPWATPFIYSSSSFATDGVDSFGPYKDVTTGPRGADDNGFLISGISPNQSTGILEFVSPVPHGLKTGDLITIDTHPTDIVVWSTFGRTQLSNWIIGPIWITGPTTVACLCFTGNSGSGTTNQHLVSTTPIPINVPWQRIAPNQTLPYEFFFSMIANWPKTASNPGTVGWVNLPFASDAVYAALGTKAAQLAPHNDQWLEISNEEWNYGAGLNSNVWCQTLGKMLAYYPAGTAIYEHYQPDGTTAPYVTNGTTQLWDQGALTLLGAHAHFVYKQAYIAAGGQGDIKIVYGAQYGNIFQYMINFIKSANLPQDYMAFAPYQDVWNSQINTGMLPAGYAPNATNANWPVDVLNELLRYHTFYGNEFQNYWAQVHNSFAGTSLRAVGYEGGLQTFTNGLPFNTTVELDAFYHRSFRDTFRGHCLGLQQGNVNIANSGLVGYTYFQFHFGYLAPFWYLGRSPAQPWNTAALAANQFETPQGGWPGLPNAGHYEQTRGAPGIAGLNDWIGGQRPPKNGSYP